MTEQFTRRGLVAAGAAVATVGLARPVLGATTSDVGAGSTFPATDPELAKEIVNQCHRDVDRVLELLKEDQSLALASWDWGFGDWETALGAASHMGRRDIAQALLDHGARANLFTWAMMDQVDTVRAVCEAHPGIQGIRGPHGIPLLGHALMGKAERVEAFLRELGGADVGEPRLELAEEQAVAYLGEYVAKEDGMRLVVERNRRGGIGLLPVGGTHRMLHRTGEHVFSPSGAPHVTVRFAVAEGRAVGLTMHRGRPILAAQRVSD